MGTNFYWIAEGKPCHACGVPALLEGSAREGDHIGKRSAAGLYCWDCDRTLCPGGKERIHYDSGATWPTRCPSCGKVEAAEGGLTTPGNAAGVELGFAKPRGEGERPKGVASTSSFSWAETPDTVRARCESGLDRVLIVDEYGREYTGRAFLAMLRAQCAVEFTHHIGQSFS